MRTLAMVESPAQLLNVLEWAHQTGADLRQLTTVVLAPANPMSRLQLHRTSELAAAAGHTVHWLEPRQEAPALLRSVVSMAGELRRVERLVVGDAFSGAIQLVLGLSRPRQVVLVDDGTATLELARLWGSGQQLVRWHSRPLSRARRLVAAQARRHIGSRACQVSMFTAMPVQLDGVDVVSNTFSWVRSSFGAPSVKPTGDLVGTSLVETGVVDSAHYLAGVRSLAHSHSIDRYFAHRLESADKLAQIARLGLQVVRPDLPLEIVARRDPIGRVLVSFPSTVVYTLPLVLADTRAQVLLCDIADDWYTSHAPSRCDRFLGQVTTSARSQHGLLSVAC